MLAAVDFERLRTRLARVIERTNTEDPRELRRRIAALERLQKPQTVVERVEVPVLQPQQLETLQELVKGLRAVADDLSIALAKAQSQEPARIQKAQPAQPNAGAALLLKPLAWREGSATMRSNDELQLRAGERRVLQTLAQRYPTKLTRAQFGTLAWSTPGGGTFGTYLGTLRRSGLIEADGKQVQASETLFLE